MVNILLAIKYWKLRCVLLPYIMLLYLIRLQYRRRQQQVTPVLLPRKSHGWRSLVGCSPWGCKELDTTERLHFHFSLSCIREGNGNPLQCSCLENPRDSRAGWAAVYGVTRSRTWLKWLSSRLQYSINITFICIEKQKKSYNLLYFDIHIVEVVWSQIQNIFEACLYTEQMSHIYTHYNLPACREWHI